MTLHGSRVALFAAVLILTPEAGGANAASAADQPAPDSYWVYYGCYTGGAGGSKGLTRSKFDAKTGKLSEPELAAEMASPSFLTIHPNGKFLYAVGEGGGKDGGPVVAFALDAKTGELKKLNEEKSGGPGPCHVAVSPKGDYAAVANYGGGSTALFKIDSDGKLAKAGFVQHKGSSVNKGRQGEPHAHCCAFSPTGDHLVTVDLGIDKVKAFKIDPKTGLIELEKHDSTTPAGSGPRHIAFSRDGECAYVCGELNSTVNVIGDEGKVIQSLSTLPEPTEGNSTAECILSPDGKFVYVSNRGHNSIAVFKVGADRKLTAAGHITGDIKIPRNFAIDPSGKWMLIASQDGHKVGVFEMDAKTGGAKETDVSVKVGSPVCVKFVPVEK